MSAPRLRAPGCTNCRVPVEVDRAGRPSNVILGDPFCDLCTRRWRTEPEHIGSILGRVMADARRRCGRG